jgi:hypothetical protein
VCIGPSKEDSTSVLLAPSGRVPWKIPCMNCTAGGSTIGLYGSSAEAFSAAGRH